MSGPRTLALLGLLAVAGGCDRDEPTPPPTPKVELRAAAPKKAPTIDPRDQYQLVADLADVRRADLEDDPGAYDRLVRSWQGKRYDWELAVIPMLCRRADQCLAAPVDHRRLDERRMQGWLPRLQLDEGAFAALKQRCDGKTRCIVRVQATMRELVAAEELPTRLTLDVAAVTAAREARADESWIVRGS